MYISELTWGVSSDTESMGTEYSGKIPVCEAYSD